MRLAVALRFFAGGQLVDLMDIYKLGKTECFKSIYKVVDAVNAAIKIEFPIDDLRALDVLEREFAARSRQQVWRGQVGATDGCHFAMRNPGKAVPNPLKYHVSRKSMYALLCIATCDADRRFLDYDISQTPTTHDSLAFQVSKFGSKIAEGRLPEPYYLNADAAFPCSRSIVTPTGETEFTDFDFEQSSNRMPIECAFGNLSKARTKTFVLSGSLSVFRPLRYSHSTLGAALAST